MGKRNKVSQWCTRSPEVTWNDHTAEATDLSVRQFSDGLLNAGINLQEKLDAVGSSGQSGAANQQNEQNNVRKRSREIHHLRHTTYAANNLQIPYYSDT